MNIKATDIRKGFIIRYKNHIVRIVSAIHHTPGNLRAMMQVDMKDVETGTNLSNRFRADETVEKVSVDYLTMEYLYPDGDHFVFMNGETYDQILISKSLLGEQASYLLPNMKVTVSMIDEKPVLVELPQKMTFIVKETEPGIKNATATNVTKPATLETGLAVQVPPFVNTGDKIIINTETGQYVSRA